MSKTESMLCQKNIANYEDCPEEEAAKSDLFLTQYHTEIQTWKQTARKSNRLSGGLLCRFIWQCVTNTKKGKKFCPDSKGIAEEIIELAFVEAYKLLCNDNRDVLEEFLARTEETLSQDNAGKQLEKIEKGLRVLEAKRTKLVDMRLEETLDKATFESKYLELTSQIEQLQEQQSDLQAAAETENTMKARIAEFRKTLEQNNVLDKFDRYVFESIVEKVIVGGYDKDGHKNPFKLTFIYKTGFHN